jgi:hypothetical protein
MADECRSLAFLSQKTYFVEEEGSVANVTKYYFMYVANKCIVVLRKNEK